MRKLALSLLVVCGCMAKAYAVAPGFYLGLMTGPSTNSASTVNVPTLSGSPPTTPVEPKSNQWGTALFFGYKNNDYIGSELGLNFFSNVKFTSKYNVQTAGGTSAHVRDIYVVLKGTFPFGSMFDVFGKIGPAFEYISTSGGLSNTGRTKYQTKIAPFYAIGASWTMDQSWVADISVNQLAVGGVIKSVTWYALGISYHFVDRYCGQFLCD